jgi:hypothetical protein
MPTNKLLQWPQFMRRQLLKRHPEEVEDGMITETATKNILENPPQNISRRRCF